MNVKVSNVNTPNWKTVETTLSLLISDVSISRVDHTSGFMSQITDLRSLQV